MNLPMPATETTFEPLAARDKVRVSGKLFLGGKKKFFLKGVTYGPFSLSSHGFLFPGEPLVVRDFALMAKIASPAGRVFQGSDHCHGNYIANREGAERGDLARSRCVHWPRTWSLRRGPRLRQRS